MVRVKEACVPWDPIPEIANRFSEIDVKHVEEWSRSLTIDLAASWQEPEFGTGAWRLTFPGFTFYRKRSIGYEGNRPLKMPKADDWKSLWEVFPSNYLMECSAPEGVSKMRPDLHLHHFVILAGGVDVYEVVASGWTCQPLPEEWAYPFESIAPDPT